MNRRDLFKLLGAGAVITAAGLALPSTTTYFLPPRCGWKPSQLGLGYMREVGQYVINRDEYMYRYDAIGRDIWGKEHQIYIESLHEDAEIAAHVISSRFQHDGLIAVPIGQAREFKLDLPRGYIPGRYI